MLWSLVIVQRAINFCEHDPQGISNSKITRRNVFWIIMAIIIWSIVFIIMYHDRLLFAYIALQR